MKLLAFFIALIISLSGVPALAHAQYDYGTPPASVDASASANAQASTTPKRPLPQILDKKEDRVDKAEDRRDAARDGGAADKREDMRDKAEDRIDARTTGLVGVRAGIAARVHGETVRFALLLQAHINRLENIVERLLERADRMDQAGMDTTDGRSHLATASAELRLAQSDLDALKVEATANASLTDEAADGLKGKYENARALMKSAREHIRRAFTEIHEAVKAFRLAVEVHAETDASVTP